MKYARITKREAKKLFAENKSFFIIPCKMMIDTMWHIEFEVNPFKYWEDHRVTYGGKSPSTKILHPEMECFDTWEEWQNWLDDKSSYTAEEKEKAWESMYNHWAYYNTNYEMGYYAHYYVEKL